MKKKSAVNLFILLAITIVSLACSLLPGNSSKTEPQSEGRTSTPYLSELNPPQSESGLPEPNLSQTEELSW